MGHPGPPHYGAGPSPHAVVAPLYPSLTPTHGTAAGVKRPRPDDLDLTVSGLPELEQGDLDSMQQTPMGSAYAQAAAAPPTHHHHRLPDTGPPSKLMRRDGEGGGGGGAPSVVGQAGMPPPAPRPRGPKLKFTPEDDQLLIDLKENKNLTWKQIADFFPGRSSGTLQVRYCTKLKAKTTQWTEETVSCSGTLPTQLFDGGFAQLTRRYQTGSEAQDGAPRLRERKVAHRRQQGRDGLHAGGLPGTSGAVAGRELIAITVPACRVNFCRGGLDRVFRHSFGNDGHSKHPRCLPAVILALERRDGFAPPFFRPPYRVLANLDGRASNLLRLRRRTR